VPKRKIDMSGVSEEIKGPRRSKHVPEGDYLLKIMEGEWRDGEKADYINWRYQIVEGVGGKKHKGATLYDMTSLSPKALWNLRNLIFAAKGKNMAGKAFNFDPESLVGLVVGATVEDDEYDGNIRSRPVDYFPKEKFEASDEEESDEEDDEDDDEEDEVEEEDEDLEDIDVDDDL